MRFGTGLAPRSALKSAEKEDAAVNEALRTVRATLDRAGVTNKNISMNREQVLRRLRAHERELRNAGIVRLSLFGSTARGDEEPESDVDLLAAFDDARRLSLLDIVGIELQLSDLLGVRVDLSEEGTLNPRVRHSVETEALRAF